MKVARLVWDYEEHKWNLQIFKNGNWVTCTEYGIKEGGYQPLFDETDYYINDNVLREMASLQARGYKVTVIV